MNGAGDTRYELKMVYDGLSLFEVRTWVHTHPSAFLKAYPVRQVNNIYFDTVDLDTLNDHLSGVGERRKLRFRWYGKDINTARGALELKQKINRMSRKAIRPLSDTLHLKDVCWSQIISGMVDQTDTTFRELLGVSQPILLNHYRREYYVSANEGTRLTLDYALTAYDQRFSQRPNLHFQIPQRHEVIIELKSNTYDNPHLSEVLAGFPLRAERRSKYVDALSAMLW